MMKDAAARHKWRHDDKQDSGVKKSRTKKRRARGARRSFADHGLTGNHPSEVNRRRRAAALWEEAATARRQHDTYMTTALRAINAPARMTAMRVAGHTFQRVMPREIGCFRSCVSFNAPKSGEPDFG